MYDPDKIDVVIVTEIKSQSSVATVIAELKDKSDYTIGLVPTIHALLCPER